MEKQDPTFQKRFPNCGIVFLHPFLTQLFEEQELLLNKKFKNRASQIKAIQLLHYLATSKIDFEDADELYILKILIGIPTDDLIIFPKPLTKKEESACDIVTRSLIQHWSVLKNVSIAGLQKQFIQKEGLINIRENAIEIYLETSSLDILLDQIPFNFSLIKLPWLQKFLTVSI